MPSTTLSTLLTTYSPLSTPFLLHALIELPASLQFLLLPSRQLIRATPHAHALIRQYALLLLSSVVIALTFGLHPSDLPLSLLPQADPSPETTAIRGNVAAALALYHVGPAVRSAGRLWGRWRGARGVLGTVVSEPGVYLVVHVFVGWELGRCAWVCRWVEGGAGEGYE